MKRLARPHLSILVGALLPFALSACGGGGGGPSFCPQIEQRAQACDLPPFQCLEPPDDKRAEVQCVLDCMHEVTCDDLERAMTDEEGPHVDCVDNCHAQIYAGQRDRVTASPPGDATAGED